MPSQRDILNQISTVKKTRQITRAMNMVAAAKLRGLEVKNKCFQPYAIKYSDFFAKLSIGIHQDIHQNIHSLLFHHKKIDRIGLFLFTADRGLCGSFNMNLINTALRFANEREKIGQQIKYFLVGRKARDFYRRRNVDTNNAIIGVMNKVDFELAMQIADLGIKSFLAKEIQEIYIIYSSFRSVANQVPVMIKFLPISTEFVNQDQLAKEKIVLEPLAEPSFKEILIDFLPRYANVIIYNALLNTATSEQAARMAAMDNASKNCKDMIDNLTLAYNKVRQASITAELMDIVGGAEALKG